MNRKIENPAEGLYRTVGLRLREARQKQRWTRAQLADALAPYVGQTYSTATLRRWESGLRQSDVADLWALCRVFGTSLDYWLAPFDSSDKIGGETAFDEVDHMLTRDHSLGRSAWTAAGAPDFIIAALYGDPARSEMLADLDERLSAPPVPSGAVEVEIQVIDGKTYFIPKGGE